MPADQQDAYRRDFVARIPQKPQPYLGIVTRDAGPDLAAQLRQPEGFGLVVEDVLPDSPAKTAGLERNDLILRFEDQWLVNPPQLEALVRRAGKDKETNLTILRGGAEQKITIKVGEKLLPERRALPMGNPGRIQQFDPQFQPRYQPDRPEAYPRPPQRRSDAEGADGRNDGERQVRYAEERARVVRSDEKGRYELRRVDGTRTFIAQKPDGEVAWQGPVETPAQREAVPAELRQKLEVLERTMHGERQPGTDRGPGERAPVDRPSNDRAPGERP
jgi:hypothetical protein